LNSVRDEDDLLVRFLLRETTEEESAQLEQRLIGEQDFFETLQGLEEDLFQDYVKGVLQPDRRARFEEVFLTSPEGRRRLAFTKALSDALSKQAGAPSAAPETSRGTFAARFWRLSWANLGYAAGALGLIVAIGATWIAVSSQRSTSRLESLFADQRTRNAELGALLDRERARGSQLERELSKHRLAPALSFLLLPSDGVRSSETAGREQRLAIPPAAGLVEFRLLVPPSVPRNDRYRVSLQTVEGTDLTSMEARPETAEKGATIVSLAVRGNLLPSGDYVLELRALSPSGVRQLLSAYSFRVVDR
jgi:hypothetical protein